MNHRLIGALTFVALVNVTPLGAGERRAATADGMAPAVPAHGEFACSTPHPSAEEIRLERQRLLRRSRGQAFVPLPRGSVIVQVAFHVIRDQAGAASDLSWVHLKNQVEALNKGFSDTPFRFVIDQDRTSWTTDSRWLHMIMGSAEERQAKSSRLGDARTLNIYTVLPQLPPRSPAVPDATFCNNNPNFCNSGGRPVAPLGWATFPSAFAAQPLMDGVVLDFRTLPGVPQGPATQHTLGHIGVHEVGHWLGLFHTYQGGCADLDLVDDTPAEDTPVGDSSDACRRTDRDTCPDKPGKDPVHNYMTISLEECMNNFTPGQAERMDEQARLYRMFRVPSMFFAHYGQFDTDGRADRLYRIQYRRTSTVQYSDGTADEIPSWCSHDGSSLYVGDFNGDKRDDLLCKDNGNMWIRYANGSGRFLQASEWHLTTTWCSHSGAKLYVGDFNGDGRADLLCHDGAGATWIRYADAAGHPDGAGGREWTSPDQWCLDPAKLHLGRFFGSRRTDLLCHESAGNIVIRYANGRGRFDSSSQWYQAGTWCSHSGAEQRVADFNGDGRDDLLCHDGAGNVWIRLADASGHLPPGNDWYKSLGYCAYDGAQLNVADLNGDGRPDLACDDVDENHSELLNSGGNFDLSCAAPCKSGSYDGANCYFATAPPGTTPFVYDRRFLYYTPAAGKTCPAPGSSFDGANCFVGEAPPPAQPFVYANSLYCTPSCRP